MGYVYRSRHRCPDQIKNNTVMWQTGCVSSNSPLPPWDCNKCKDSIFGIWLTAFKSPAFLHVFDPQCDRWDPEPQSCFHPLTTKNPEPPMPLLVSFPTESEIFIFGNPAYYISFLPVSYHISAYVSFLPLSTNT